MKWHVTTIVILYTKPSHQMKQILLSSAVVPV